MLRRSALEKVCSEDIVVDSMWVALTVVLRTVVVINRVCRADGCCVDVDMSLLGIGQSDVPGSLLTARQRTAHRKDVVKGRNDLAVK